MCDEDPYAVAQVVPKLKARTQPTVRQSAKYSNNPPRRVRRTQNSINNSQFFRAIVGLPHSLVGSVGRSVKVLIG